MSTLKTWRLEDRATTAGKLTRWMVPLTSLSGWQYTQSTDTIDFSVNVTSSTDHIAGRYTMTFTTAAAAGDDKWGNCNGPAATNAVACQGDSNYTAPNITASHPNATTNTAGTVNDQVSHVSVAGISA